MKNSADGLELDVRITKDKKVVIFHDQDLKRMANVDHKVVDIEYDRLPQLLEKTPQHFCANEYYTIKPEIDSRKIPLLEDLFKISKGKIIFVEIKDPNEESIKIVGDLITKYNRQELTVYALFLIVLVKYELQIHETNDGKVSKNTNLLCS